MAGVAVVLDEAAVSAMSVTIVDFPAVSDAKNSYSAVGVFNAINDAPIAYSDYGIRSCVP